MAISIAWNGAIGLLVRICGSCGRKVLQGRQCDCRKQRHQVYDWEHRDKAHADFYGSTRWKGAAEAARSRAGYADEYALHYEHKLVPGKTVHHIVPIDEAPELMLDLNNLICVSAKTHDMIHAEYKAGTKRKAEMQVKLSDIRKHG